MRFTCRKTACILLGLFLILPGVYLWEHGRQLNWSHLGAIVLIILCCLNSCCNNYKLEINSQSIVLERLVGRTIQIETKEVYQIEMKGHGKDRKLLVYTRSKLYPIAIRCLEEQKIHKFLEEEAPKWQIVYNQVS